jgi:uncharacterized membrane protein
MLATPARWAAYACYACALLFAAASAGMGALYGYARGGGDPALGAIWAAISAAASIVAALAWPAVIGSVERRNWSRASTALCALLLTGCYSVAGALGSAAGGRADATNLEQSASGARARAEAAYSAASAALSKLPPSRTTDEVMAVVKRIAMSGRLPTATVEAELARAKERQRLQARMDAASAELSKVGAPKQANSDAVALASFTGASPDTTAKILTLLTMFLIEMGAGLSLAVGMALQVHRSPSPPLPAAPQPEPEPVPVVEPTPQRQPQLIAPSPAVSRLLDHLRAAGGAVSCSQSSLGKSLGVSRTRVCQMLRTLEGRGLILVEPSPTGTTIRLRA